MPGVSTAYQTGIHSARPANGAGCVLYSCTTHGLVYRDDGSSWTTFLTLPSAGFTDPMTTRGDSIVRNASNVTARLAVGGADTVMKSDGTDPSWGKVLPAQLDVSADNTTANATSGHHGLLPKLSGSSSDVLLGDGTFGAGGGSGVDNWLVDIIAALGSHGNTNWTTLNLASTEYTNGDLESSGAQNDEIYWDLGLSGGTWDVSLFHDQANNRGIYTVSIDGTSIGTIDGYQASVTLNVHSTITGVSISAGKRRLKLKMATKNASSSNYFGTIIALQLRRTA